MSVYAPKVLFVYFVLIVLLWRSEGQWMCRGGAGQPPYCGSPCPCRQDCRSISQLNACFTPGRYEIRGDWLEQSTYHKRYLLFCFVVTRFYLCRTKCFFSPWMKGLLFIPVNAIVLHKALYQKWLCWDVRMVYFCWLFGHIKVVERSSFTWRFLV